MVVEMQMVAPDRIGQLEDIESFIASSDGNSSSKRMLTTRTKEVLQPSPLQWAGITCFQLVYSLVNTGMGLFVLPTEAERLNKESGSIWVGVYLAVCGLTQLACPLAGKLSDRHASIWGRRRPFIVAGTVFASAGFAAMWAASNRQWPIIY